MQQSYGYYSHSKSIKSGILILCLLYGASILGVKVDAISGFFYYIYPLNIVITLIVLLTYQKHWNPRSVLALFILYFSGFFVEAAASRFLAAHYGYFSFKSTLGPKLFDVPLVIGMYWLVLIYCVGLLIKDIKTDIFSKCALGAIIIVLYDILLEQVAKKLVFWDFKGHIVPIENYVAWFAVSFFMLLFFLNLKAKIRNPISPYIFVIQFVYLLLMILF